MTELLRLVVDIIQPLWPVRLVMPWQKGLYFLCGRYCGEVNPGVWPILPYFGDVKCVSVVPEVYPLPLQTVTLRDGSTLTYSVSITVVVRDAAKAYLKLGHYTETVGELAAAMVSEGLADADPARFDPARGKRDRLLDEIRQELNKEIGQYGVEATAVRLNNFAKGIRTLRLLLDKAVLTEGPTQTQNH